MELQVDPDRASVPDSTGIYIRAKRDGRLESVDIGCLTRESLWYWLTTLKPDQVRATVLAILAHDHHTDLDKLPRLGAREFNNPGTGPGPGRGPHDWWNHLSRKDALVFCEAESKGYVYDDWAQNDEATLEKRYGRAAGVTNPEPYGGWGD